MRVPALFLIITGSAVAAQGARPGDEAFSAQELHQLLAGYTAEFYDGSQARYAADGGYMYRYGPRELAYPGRFNTTEDGQVCVDFSDGNRRCDTIVRANGRLVLVTEQGHRFPLRDLTANLPLEPVQ